MVKKIIFAGLLVLFVHNLLFASAPKPKRTIDKAIEFTLLDLDGKKISLSDFKGKPVVLLFWAISCPVCRQSLQELNTFYPDLSASGIKLLAIDIYEPQGMVKRFAQRRALPYTVLLDENGLVADNYGIMGIPTYIIINREGRIIFRDYYFPRQDYKQIISQ